jgi:integrase
MKRHETESNQPSSVKRQSHAPSFAKVHDGRKQPIRGLWVRNGRFYARLSVENAINGVKEIRRVPLVDKDGAAVQTVAQAVAELKRLQTHRADSTLPVLGMQPKFGDYAKTYLDSISAGEGKKAPATIEKERSILGRWTEAIGQLRLNQIKRVHVNRFILSRQQGTDAGGNPKEVSNRTINLDVIVFRCVMKKALEEQLIAQLPTWGMKELDEKQTKRQLFSTADLEKLCNAAFETKQDKHGDAVPVTKNAQEFTDYVRLMAYCGARRNEALGLKWDDLEFENGELHIRRQVTRHGTESSKNGEERTVDFNPKLRAHLLDMQKRARGVSKWLFPSPQRGDKDIPAKSFRESLELAKERAGLPHVGFHDMRHQFISMSVMSGIDYMTIASWVGHKDGGILIGRVYGHLANEHKKAMAQRLNFGPVVIESAAVG